MGQSPRRAALYATAKLALGSAGGLGLGLLLSNCGGEAISSAEPGPDASGAPAAGGARSTAAGGVPSGGRASASGGIDGVGLACAGPVDLTLPPQLPGPTDAEFQCCFDLVATNQGQIPPDPGPLDASVDNCCRLILKAVEVDFASHSMGLRVRNPCCSIFPPTEAARYYVCTPWGPPVPPDIEWEAA